MREWLSGRAPPCQGGGRGSDSRLALNENKVSSERMRPCFYSPHMQGKLWTVREANCQDSLAWPYSRLALSERRR